MTRCGARVASRRTVQQVGGSFGTAVLAVILSGAVAAHHGHLARAFDIAF